MIKILNKGFDPINFIRVVATLMVFFLHTSLFTGKYFAGDAMFSEYFWSFIFKTPAWAGCWIFFVLSGYLAGMGFINGKYNISKNSIIQYYTNKIRRIWFPTVCFIFICAVFVYPSFFVDNPRQILAVIFCTYNGIPGVDGLGATWYVFSLMWLYLFTPIIHLVIGKYKGHILKILFFTIMIGLLYRLIIFKLHIDWYKYAYTAAWANIDLYVSGFCMAYLNLLRRKIKILLNMRIISALLLFVLIIFNSFIYSKNILLQLYQFVFPTIYSIFICFYIYAFCNYKEIHKDKWYWMIINRFSSISFEFYLFHSLVLARISKLIGGSTSLQQYFRIVFISGFITVLLSFGFHKMFQNYEKTGTLCSYNNVKK